MTEEKEKIINAFNNAWNKKIASENSYGKLASKEMFENKEEIKTEISTDCSYYKDVVNQIKAECPSFRKTSDGVELCQGGNIGIFKEYSYLCVENKNCYYKQLKRLEQENKELKEICIKICYQSHGYTCRIWELKESKYKSTLEEIKHILEIHKDELEECLHNDIDGIIQTKINEVLNE